MNLFGKKKAAPAPPLRDSISMLHEALRTLQKREDHLLDQIDLNRKQAKEKLKAKDKRGALHLLQRCKLLEKQVNQIYGKKSNIDVQILALENAVSNREIYNVMKTGRDALQQATREADVDKVADVMEDLQEAIQMNEEINDQLSQPIGPQLDEDELAKELEDLENELVDEQIMDAPTAPIATKPISTVSSTPSTVLDDDDIKQPASKPTVSASSSSSSSSSNSTAPTTAKKQLNEKEQKELRELEALMGM